MKAFKFPYNQMAIPSSSIFHKLNPPPLHLPIKNPTTTTTVAATRRSSILLISLLSTSTHIEAAAAFDFRLTVPEQSLEEAESGIKSHAQSLVEVKDLLMAESWKEAQKLLRKSSALLKQDIYTITQAKSAAERPRLRKLYSELFNTVTKLDYAARDKDKIRVWECYDSIVLSLDAILSAL